MQNISETKKFKRWAAAATKGVKRPYKLEFLVQAYSEDYRASDIRELLLGVRAN